MKRKGEINEKRSLNLYPIQRECPNCQEELCERYRKRRTIVNLKETLELTSHFLECPNKGCPMSSAVFRPEEESILALKGYTFGLDVVVRTAELRYRENRSIPEIYDILKKELKKKVRGVREVCRYLLQPS